MPPTYEPRATGHITQMIALIERLISNGSAYSPGNGDVYLEVNKVKNYLSLSNQKLGDLLVADYVDTACKKDPKDFALWKAAKEGEPSWPTPWGDGRPGWHIECSAMAHAYLGESFDIHGGGLDLIFPHHENEIAQSNAAGFGFANIWMHNAWVTTSGEKMSKSLGNSLQVTGILKKVRGVELRWYLGSAHYRSTVEFSSEALAESATAFKRIEAFLSRAEVTLGKAPELLIADEFAKAMNDDLAVPQVLAFIAESMRIGNSAAENKKVIAKTAGEIRGALSILGCDPKDAAFAATQSNNDAMNGLIKLALDQREAARLREDFAAADLIRDQIGSLGITVEDTTNGPRWSY
jgi:cysteinyl-tRNA synthetase